MNENATPKPKSEKVDSSTLVKDNSPEEFEGNLFDNWEDYADAVDDYLRLQEEDPWNDGDH